MKSTFSGFTSLNHVTLRSLPMQLFNHAASFTALPLLFSLYPPVTSFFSLPYRTICDRTRTQICFRSSSLPFLYHIGNPGAWTSFSLQLRIISYLIAASYSLYKSLASSTSRFHAHVLHHTYISEELFFPLLHNLSSFFYPFTSSYLMRLLFEPIPTCRYGFAFCVGDVLFLYIRDVVSSRCSFTRAVSLCTYAL